MTGWKDWLGGLRALKLPRDAPLIVHASLSAFGYVTGGAQMVVSALLQEFNTVIMPTFTYATMVTPEVGPADNGLSYGTAQYSNARAVFF